MNSIAERISEAEAPRQRPATIETTLFELIEAVGEEVSPGEDGLVVAVVSHLLDSGRVKLRAPRQRLTTISSGQKIMPDRGLHGQVD